MKTQNLTDLNGYLFEQLERLNADNIAPDILRKEIKRSEAVTSVATAIINNATLVLKAEQAFDKRKMVDIDAQKPALLE